MSETPLPDAVPTARKFPLGAVLAFVGLCAVLGVVGVGLLRSQQGTVVVGRQAPNFVLTTFDGEEISLRSLRGKIVVVNFWASWCKPCEQEAAELQQAWQEYEPTGQVVFLGVDYVDTEPDARVYLKKFGITFSNGPDLATRISQYFRIKGVPETYFIDREGVLHYVQVGPFSSVQQIRDVLDPMLAK